MAKFVQYKDIVAAYNNKVADIMARGYTIFIPTMGGSQGEEAHIHLIDPTHKVVYGVILERDSDWGDGSDYKMVIRIMGQTAEDLRCENLDQLYAPGNRCTFWNNKGVEVYKQTWYAMAQGNDRSTCYYTTDEQVPAQAKARREYKYRNRLYDHSGRWNDTTTAQFDMNKLVKFVRKHGGRGYGNCKAEEIKGVRKYSKDGVVRYLIDFNGSKKQLAF